MCLPLCACLVCLPLFACLCVLAYVLAYELEYLPAYLPTGRSKVPELAGPPSSRLQTSTHHRLLATSTHLLLLECGLCVLACELLLAPWGEACKNSGVEGA